MLHKGWSLPKEVVLSFHYDFDCDVPM